MFGNYCQCTPDASWIACTLLCCPSSRYWSGSVLPWIPGSAGLRILADVWRKSHLLLGQAICSVHSWQHCHAGLLGMLGMLGCYLNAQLGHHPFLGRAPCIPTVFSHKWQLPFLTIPYFINSLSIHCSTPATGASPPHLSDLKETVALYSHTDLQFLLFIPYAVCICAWALQRGT